MTKGQKAKLATIADYQQVFNSAVGQRVLWDMMKSFGFMEHSHVPGDPYSTAFHEGQRNVVLSIHRTLKMNLKGMEELIKQGEQQDESISEDIIT